MVVQNDIDRIIRPQGNAFDIGCYEYQYPSLNVIYVDVAEDPFVYYSFTYLIIFLPMTVHTEITGGSCRRPEDPKRGDTKRWAC